MDNIFKSVNGFGTINEIETIKAEELEQMGIKPENIKGYKVYFINLNEFYKRSALVYDSETNNQIRHACKLGCNYDKTDRATNLYKSSADLYKLYIKSLLNTLYTDEEITGPDNNPDSIRLKNEYIHNHYGYKHPHVSAFQILSTKKQEEDFRNSIKGFIYDPVCFAYFKPEYKNFVIKHIELKKALDRVEKENKNNFEYWKKEFYYEMCNHEYGINSQADYDVVSCYADVDNVKDYENRDKLIQAAGFSDIQKSAYTAARKKYYADAIQNEWF